MNNEPKHSAAVANPSKHAASISSSSRNNASVANSGKNSAIPTNDRKPGFSFLLQESGYFLRSENGSKIVLTMFDTPFTNQPKTV